MMPERRFRRTACLYNRVSGPPREGFVVTKMGTDNCGILLASGPFLTPSTSLVFLILLACPVLAFSLFAYALVQFCRGSGSGERSFTCFILGCLFLAPLLGLQTDGLHVLIIFGIVVAIAWPTWIYRVVRKR